MLALHQYAESHNGNFPEPWNLQAAEEIVKIAEHCNSELLEASARVAKVDVELIKKMSFTSQASFAPLAAFTGGVVSQECLKSLSGKYTPLNQWMYLDAVEVLPAEISSPGKKKKQKQIP